MNLIPKPRRVEVLGGSIRVTLPASLAVNVNFASIEEISELLRDILGWESAGSGTVIRITSMLRELGLERIETKLEEEAYALRIDEEVKIYAKSYRGLVNALATLKQLYDKENSSLPRVLIVDYPAFKYRGIVEGFYYRPWSWSDRREMVRFMALYKMNAYIYAPKDDPYHRDKWRLNYPEEILEEIKALVETAKKYGVEFIFAVSPGLSAVYSSKEDEDKLVEKLLSIAKLGVKIFGIFYDDIPGQLIHEEDKKKYSSLAEAHADFTNRVLKRLKQELGDDVTIVVTPTEYMGVELGQYFKELSEKLAEGVYIMWTGPLVCSLEISYDAASKVSKLSQNRLLVWDNYPVNDYARNRLNMGPLRGRDPKLHEVIHGFFFNPMNEAHASQIPLATAADYTWNPEEYEPDRSLEAALRIMFGEKAGDFRFLISQLGESTLWPREPVEAGLADKLRKGDVPEELETYFRKLASLQGSICPNGGKLCEDLEPYLYKLGLYGEAGLEGLRAYKADNIQAAWTRLVEMLRKWDVARGLFEIVGCTSQHEEPAWFTKILRNFLDEIITLLAQAVITKWGLKLEAPLITSNVDHKEGHDISKAFKGTREGVFVSRRGLRGMENITVEFREPREKLCLEFSQSFEQIGETEPAEYVVQAMVEGEWREVGAVTSGRICVEGKVKAIKIAAESAKPTSATLKVDLRGSEPKVYTSISSRCSILNIVDGRADTFFEVEGAGKGDWIIIDLGGKRKISKIRILQDPIAVAPLQVHVASEKLVYPVLSFEYIEWIPVGRVASHFSEIPVNRETGYVKISLAGKAEKARIIQVQIY